MLFEASLFLCLMNLSFCSFASQSHLSERAENNRDRDCSTFLVSDVVQHVQITSFHYKWHSFFYMHFLRDRVCASCQIIPRCAITSGERWYLKQWIGKITLPFSAQLALLCCLKLRRDFRHRKLIWKMGAAHIHSIYRMYCVIYLINCLGKGFWILDRTSYGSVKPQLKQSFHK